MFQTVLYVTPTLRRETAAAFGSLQRAAMIRARVSAEIIFLSRRQIAVPSAPFAVLFSKSTTTYILSPGAIFTNMVVTYMSMCS
jgi:hypothetical protein